MKFVKTLGLACFALLALTATVGASFASASQFRAEEYPTIFKGQQGTENARLFFKITEPTAGKLVCSTANLTGTVSVASSALELTPSSSGCHFDGLAATFSPNGCRYVLHSTSESPPYKGTVDIACASESASIEAKTQTCKVTIPAQTNLGTVEFSNTGEGRSRKIVAAINLSKMRYTYYPGCPESGKEAKTYETGTLAGTVTFSGLGNSEAYPLGVYLANEQIEDPKHFTAEKYPAAVKGPAAKPTFKFNAWGGPFNCGESYLSAEFGSARGNLSATPAFNGCALAGIKFVIENNGCTFPLELTAGDPANKAGMGLYCPGKPMTLLLGSSCVVKLASQEWPGSVEFHNTGTGAGRGIEWKASITGIKYEESACPGGENGTFSNGELTANWSLTANNGGPADGLWIE